MRYTCQTSARFIKKPFFNIHPITQSVLVIIGMSMTGVSAHAATSDAATSEAETTLPSLTFTTTATKTPTLVKNTIAQTSVIDEEQLQRYRGQSVIDVLRSQAGVHITQNGADGSASNFYLRGYEGKQVLVLIDGVRYSSMTIGTPALYLIPADQIDRIEILYGASGASLYGADAMGGVIQIFTKGQNAQQSNVALTIGGGTQNSYKGQITGQYVNDTSTLSLSTGYEKTDGINATRPDVGSNYFADKDGFESKSASFVAKHKINDAVDVGVNGLVSKSTSDFDSGTTLINTYSDQKNGAASAYINFNQDKLSANLKYGQSFDKTTTYDSTSPQGNTFDTTQKQLNLQLGYKLPVGQLIAGLEHLKQEADVNADYGGGYNAIYDLDRTVKSLFTSYLVTQNNFDFQAGVRRDDHSEYDKHTSYNIGSAYRINPTTRLGLAYSTGFKAPTVQDIYYGSGKVPFQTNKNWEAFIENSGKNRTTRLTGYQSDIENKTIWADGKTQVIPNASIDGINLSSDWKSNALLFGFDYDYQKAKNETTNQTLYYHPKNKATVYVGYQQPKYDLRAEVSYTDKSISPDYRTYPETRQTLDDYTLLNISANYYLSPNLTINTRINNLTDTSYQTVYGYNATGTNAFASLTYQWF
ncbi:TonB-dependent receptor [Moraxella osloensis]|nr:TonB-dependent receptor [Moraxella osloensis]OBX58487.1 TonB-dependent receptor [Moraxella osloensis]